MHDYVNWLRHASPYINAHRDCTFVVMLPGDGVEHPNFGNIVHDLVLLHSLGVRLVLVHGDRVNIINARYPRELYRFQRRTSFRVRPAVSAMPTMMALGNFSGLSAKPRAISGTIYCAEKQNATTLKTGTIYSQLPSSR